MSVAIRLKRIGKTGSPIYRIVVQEKRSRRDGRPIDELGLYDPMKDPPHVVIDNQKLDKWLKNGARVSESLNRILNFGKRK
ncbi:30S ribosomal protein S16 [Candidatus Gottesmanbacteria bacterium]|nr:30S ribosomal protein S16 [Candidatus Gottesmanbacteria bacterium]